MAFPREKLTGRQKACLILALFLIVFGVAQIVLSVFASVYAEGRRYSGVKGVITGVYLIIAGIFGAIGYFPRRTRQHCKPVPSCGRRSAGALSAVVVFTVLCSIVAILVIVDSNALDFVFSERAYRENGILFAIFHLSEVIIIHVDHLLCAICVGLAVPDIIFSGSSESLTRLDKSQNRNSKYKTSKQSQALHLPEARTHVQEAPATGDKVTVVSLPQTDGIVYAVPEEQYVIRRGEATYMAPTGNTALAAFFPTYTRVQSE